MISNRRKGKLSFENDKYIHMTLFIIDSTKNFQNWKIWSSSILKNSKTQILNNYITETEIKRRL